VFDNGSRRLGTLAIEVPADCVDEIELADTFTLEYANEGVTDRYNGRYYVIIMNKSQKM
jgi:hypothetical protein